MVHGAPRCMEVLKIIKLGARARAGVHFFSHAHEYNLLSSNHTIPYSTRPALSRAALEPLDLSLLLLVRGRVELQRGGPLVGVPDQVHGRLMQLVEAAHSAERDVGLALSEEFLCATWKAGWGAISGRRARSSRGRMRAPFSKMCISSLSVAPDTRWTVHAYLRGARHGLRVAGGCVRLEDGQVTHAGSSACARSRHHPR